MTALGHHCGQGQKLHLPFVAAARPFLLCRFCFGFLGFDLSIPIGKLSGRAWQSVAVPGVPWQYPIGRSSPLPKTHVINRPA